MGDANSFIEWLKRKAMGASTPPDLPPTANPNPNVARGRWGEDQAVKYLAGKGWKIMGREVRPCAKDRRCEIDIIAYLPEDRMLAFVEVKTHKRRSERATRLWGITREKKRNLYRACANWILRNKWHENFRFDVIEVYGDKDSGKEPEIDHIPNVPLFPRKWRFW